MRKSFLGRTGLEISELAFGGGVTGGILIDADEATRFQALRRAVAAGINWIDTAPLYGGGVSEETIGRHLRSISPQPYVSTKVRLEPKDRFDVAGAIERSLEQSLRRLNVERVSLFQLHNQIGEAIGGRPALPVSQVLGRGGVADTFDWLKSQKLIRASGFTAVGDADGCLDVIESGRFDTAQVYYNVINPSAAWSRAPGNWKAQDFSGIVQACWRQNMGTLAIRVWAGGPLARTARPERLSVMTSGTDLDNEMRCAEAVRAVLGAEFGTPAQAALRFVLSNHDLSTRVIGISTLADLDEAVDAARAGPLPGAAIAKLERLWATDFWHANGNGGGSGNGRTGGTGNGAKRPQRSNTRERVATGSDRNLTDLTCDRLRL
jgi:L-galactose dehydrogenase/L-glyceraldehyde 3-phosphate reductase